jgi:hypothetical protein
MSLALCYRKATQDLDSVTEPLSVIECVEQHRLYQIHAALPGCPLLSMLGRPGTASVRSGRLSSHVGRRKAPGPRAKEQHP